MAGRPPTGQRLVPACHAGTHDCVENSPVYTAIIVPLMATGLQSLTIDRFAILILIARIGRTTVHIALRPTNAASSLRFGLFVVQVLSMVGMGVMIAVKLAA
jgi:hypothetical protein